MGIKEIEEFAKLQGYETMTKLKDWNNYEVYELHNLEPSIMGMFRCILVKNGEMRVSTDEEAFKILEVQ